MRSLGLALALALSLPSLALAQEDALARGRTARASGDHAAALAAFEEAWRTTSSPVARGEMAVEELALGRFALAETHATEALAFGADPEIAARAADLAATRDAAAAHLGSVEIVCEGGCAVAVDGAPVGVTPLPHLVRIEGGAHAVHAERGGHRPADATVTVQAGAVARVTLAPEWIDDRPILERTGGLGDGQRIAGWSAIAATGIALVVGSVALGVELDRDAFLRSDACTPASVLETREARCPDAASLRGTYTDVARAMYVTAAVLGAAGLVLLLTAPSAPPTAPSARCAPSAAPGFVCQVEF